MTANVRQYAAEAQSTDTFGRVLCAARDQSGAVGPALPARRVRSRTLVPPGRSRLDGPARSVGEADPGGETPQRAGGAARRDARLEARC